MLVEPNKGVWTCSNPKATKYDQKKLKTTKNQARFTCSVKNLDVQEKNYLREKLCKQKWKVYISGTWIVYWAYPYLKNN